MELLAIELDMPIDFIFASFPSTHYLFVQKNMLILRPMINSNQHGWDTHMENETKWKVKVKSQFICMLQVPSLMHKNSNGFIYFFCFFFRIRIRFSFIQCGVEDDESTKFILSMLQQFPRSNCECVHWRHRLTRCDLRCKEVRVVLS